jgi:hypothetical protein
MIPRYFHSAEVLTKLAAAHEQIYEQCNILHRDISFRNLMLYVPHDDDDDDIMRRGLLIDYDYAINMGDSDRTKAEASRSVCSLSMYHEFQLIMHYTSGHSPVHVIRASHV